jgi:hypothetical protein
MHGLWASALRLVTKKNWSGNEVQMRSGDPGPDRPLTCCARARTCLFRHKKRASGACRPSKDGPGMRQALATKGSRFHSYPPRAWNLLSGVRREGPSTHSAARMPICSSSISAGHRRAVPRPVRSEISLPLRDSSPRRECHLYFAQGCLLYIALTSNVGARLKCHPACKVEMTPPLGSGATTHMRRD